MNISPDQAAEALRDVAQAESRSRELHGYQRSSPILLLWGLIWIIGYGLSGYSARASIIWLPLAVIGIGGTLYLSRRRPTDSGPEAEAWGHRGRKIGFSWLVLMIFWVCTYAIMRPHEPNQVAAFPAVWIAAVYCLSGIWMLPRFIWLGASLFALTMIGYFLFPSWFCYWMAVVGGGALVLGGLWLRKA